MKIYLIRHGETTSDIENLYGGDYDDHLTKKGVIQSEELAKKLANLGIQIIFSSPFIRAKETSEILKQSFGCEIKMANDMRERNNYGILTGMNKDEAKIKHPEIVAQLENYNSTIEGAENYNDFIKRIKEEFEYITNLQYNTIAIVTHGGPIRQLLRSVLNFGELDGDLADCAVIEIEKSNSDFKIIKIK